MEYMVTEQETKGEKDPVLIEMDTEKDDFRKFLEELRMEQQEQG